MSPKPRIARPWPFLMTPAQHQASAHQLQQMGQPELAQQHENVARMIVQRQVFEESFPAPLS
jgi:hypothetical protein